MEFVLNGVNLHSYGSQPEENLFISEPNVEFFKIQTHTNVSSDPISGFSVNFLFSSVQGNGGDIIFNSLPEINIVNESLSLDIIRLIEP
jgi:hypothetical protein